MRVLVAGTGALACLFSARLASVGNDVTMLGSWVEGLAALRQHGVHLLDLDGSSKCYSVHVMDGAKSRGDFTQALVLVKSWQTERVARQVERCLADSGLALTLQNGLGNYEILSEILKAGRVALGVTTVGARMLEPGIVQFTGKGKVSIGPHPDIGGLAELLRRVWF